jgi:predicted tellurium resistance membrane protein TerC
MLYNLIFYQLFVSLRESSEKDAAFRATGILAIIVSLNMAFLLSIFVSITRIKLPHFKIVFAIVVLLLFLVHHFRYIKGRKYEFVIQKIEGKNKQNLAKYLTICLIIVTVSIAVLAIIF